jgi:hypothetical protein
VGALDQAGHLGFIWRHGRYLLWQTLGKKNLLGSLWRWFYSRRFICNLF